MESLGVAKAPGKRCADESIYRSGVKQARCLTEDAPFPISNLPPNIIIHIFKCLSLRERLDISLVCKFWHGLVNDQDLWQRIQVKDMQKVDDDVLQRLTSLSNNVTHLDISGLYHLTDQCFISVLEKCRSLVSLKAYNCLLKNSNGEFEETFKQKAFATIGQYCPSLKQLSLDHCKGVTDTVLEAIAEGCPLLETLRISSAHEVTSAGISAIAKACPRLNYLFLESCRKIDGDGLEALAEGCPEMSALCLTGTGVAHNKLLCLGRFKKLKVLEMSDLRRLDEETMVKVVKQLSSVTTYSVSLCDAITDRVVEAIARFMTNLTKINLVHSNITDQALISFGNHAQKLEELDVSWCQEVTDEGVKFVVEKCKTLSHVSLMRCDKVTTKTMNRLVKRYPQIFFSTMYLDYRRLYMKALNAGCISQDAENPFKEEEEEEDSDEGEDTDELERRHRRAVIANMVSEQEGIPKRLEKKELSRVHDGEASGGLGCLQNGESSGGSGCSQNGETSGGSGCSQNGEASGGSGCSQNGEASGGLGCLQNGESSGGSGCSQNGETSGGSGCSQNGEASGGSGCSQNGEASGQSEDGETGESRGQYPKDLVDREDTDQLENLQSEEEDRDLKRLQHEEESRGLERLQSEEEKGDSESLQNGDANRENEQFLNDLLSVAEDFGMMRNGEFENEESE